MKKLSISSQIRIFISGLSIIFLCELALASSLGGEIGNGIVIVDSKILKARLHLPESWHSFDLGVAISANEPQPDPERAVIVSQIPQGAIQTRGGINNLNDLEEYVRSSYAEHNILKTEVNGFPALQVVTTAASVDSDEVSHLESETFVLRNSNDVLSIQLRENKKSHHTEALSKLVEIY